MKITRLLFNTVLPLAILAAGVVGMKSLIASRPSPRKEFRENPGVLVKVAAVRRADVPIKVQGTGTIQPHREVSITPQVNGLITAIAPGFVPGGFFREGEILFEIERVDYQLALEQARSARAQAELELARQQSNAVVARREWERLDKGEKGEPNPLVLYEPQLKQAGAALASADTAIRKAEIDLERTKIHAPFNCRVRSEQADTGQYVRSGVSVGIVAGSDVAEVTVPLSIDEVSRLTIPRSGSDRKGSAATVELRAGSGTYRWEGRVVRSLGEVDPRGRMTRVVVAVKDPYHLSAEPAAGKPDLEVGLFVDVSFDGGTLPDVFAVPRSALQGDATVWVADEGDTLQVREVHVVRREEHVVLVDEGLEDGDRLILTNLAGAAAGMKLRITGEETTP